MPGSQRLLGRFRARPEMIAIAHPAFRAELPEVGRRMHLR
jgi:acyl-CoA hydrolase